MSRGWPVTESAVDQLEDMLLECQDQLRKTGGERDDLIKALRDALSKIMPYAMTGAAVEDIYPSEQPEFLNAYKTLNSAEIYLKGLPS
jgi:hypothetical protein